MKSDEQAFFSMFRPTPPASDRRRSARKPTGDLATLSRTTAGAETNSLHVFVINTSESGLGLRSPIGLARGVIYRVQTGHDSKSAAINVRVVSSRKRTDGSYEVGARYV